MTATETVPALSPDDLGTRYRRSVTSKLRKLRKVIEDDMPSAQRRLAAATDKADALRLKLYELQAAVDEADRELEAASDHVGDIDRKGVDAERLAHFEPELAASRGVDLADDHRPPTLRECIEFWSDAFGHRGGPSPLGGWPYNPDRIFQADELAPWAIENGYPMEMVRAACVRLRDYWARPEQAGHQHRNTFGREYRAALAALSHFDS